MHGNDISPAGGASSRNWHKWTVFGIVLVLAVVFSLWRLDSVTTGSAGSTIERTPPPSVQQSSEQDLLAKQFRPYADAVPIVALPPIIDEETIGGVAPAVLAAQLQLLASAGLASVDDRTVRDMAMGRTTETVTNPILLTFDGARQSLWTDIDPMLEQHDFSAVVFLRPEDVAGPEGERELDRGTLQAMKSSGRWSFGVQVEAESLRRRSGEALLVWEARVRSELAAARATVEQALDIRVVSFAYPYSEWGLPQVDPAVEQRLPELVGEQFDLAFLDTTQSVVVTSASDKSKAPRLPRSRTTTNPASLLGAIDESVPREPVNMVDPSDWIASGDGSCTFTQDSLIIAADANTTCQLVSASRSTWRDVTLSGVVKGLSPTTAITFRLRQVASSQLEVTLTNDFLIVQRRVDGAWSQMAGTPIEGVGVDDPISLHVHLAGTRLEVTADGALLVSVDLGSGSESGRMSVSVDVGEAAQIALTQLVIMSDTPM